MQPSSTENELSAAELADVSKPVVAGKGDPPPVYEPGKRELVVLEHPDNLKTEAGKDAFASGIADKVVEIMNERRASKGLPPLKA